MNTYETISRAGSTTQQQLQSNTFQNNLKEKPNENQKPRYGVIVKTQQLVDETGVEQVYVIVRLDDFMSDIQQGSYQDRGFILGHTMEQIALIYGGIDDLVGMRVMVISSGARLDQGIATIVNNSGKGNLEKSNTLKPFGTALAPAGKM